MPHQFNGWATMHPKVIYDGLFKAVWATLSAFANPRHHLDGKLGAMCVLHTWGQQLDRHIHLHCLTLEACLPKINDGAIHEKQDTYSLLRRCQLNIEARCWLI
ncbi:MAG: transposase [Gammaproteobacteria bacterium]|nr:transposase [Gammaproteobacteria bacterium]